MRNVKLFFLVLIVFSLYSLMINEDFRLTKIIEKFKTYNQKFPHQQIYIQTDRNSFSAGETIWMKAYIRQGSENKPDTFSTNLYIDFINWQNKIVASKLLKIKKGIAFGEYSLPDSIPEGKYTLRAFTNSMRNFENDYFFSKEIYVKNSNPTYFTINSYQNMKQYLRKWRRDSVKVDIQFMPEGGNLVVGIESIVAFKAINRQEKGVDVRGILLNSSGKKVLSFKSTHLGMGKFSFRPEKNEKYKVKVTFEDGKSKNFDFPEALNQGFVVKIDNSNTDFVEINVRGNLPKTEDKSVNDFFIVIQNAGKLIYTQKANTKKGEWNTRIKKINLKHGLNQITLINGCLEPKCERLFYIDTNTKLNIQFSGLNKVYECREFVDVQIDMDISNDFKNRSNLAISVVNSTEISNNGNLTINIVNYFNLKSKLRGNIEEIDSYFSAKEIKANENIDLLLLTQAWRKYDWSEIMNNSKSKEFDKENQITVGGKITRDLFDIPLAGVSVQMTILNEFNEEFTTITNNKGEFIFENLNYLDTMEVLIESRKLNGQKNVLIHLNLDSVFVQNYQINPEVSMEIYSTKGRMQKRIKYQDPKKRTYEEGQPRDNSIHSSADQIIYLDQISKSGATSVEDILSQYISGFSGRGSNASIRGISSLSGSNNPSLLIDGTFVDYSAISSISIYDIERIEILKGTKSAIYGFEGANGVIAIYTKHGRFMKRGEIQFSMLGYATPRKFYSPKYKTNSVNEKTDFRKTIYWNPEVITDENGKAKVSFYNSDLKGEVMIRIEGMDRNGNLIFATTSYTVK